VALSEREVEFLTANHTGAMITVARDGTARVARVGVAMVDGRLWSSGTPGRARTKRLRRDPRCTLYVTEPGYFWLALETTVTILEGPEAAEQSLRLFRVMQGKADGPLSWFGGELAEDDFRRRMVEEERLIYQFEVLRTYGLY
jgi:PPOX class probable F420-dependent enzyme